MKINEEELTKKVLNRLKKNNLVNEYTTRPGQYVTHYVFDDGLSIDRYAVIRVNFNGTEVGHLHDSNKQLVVDAIRAKKNIKKMEAFDAL